jgi:hypothetical protein
LATLECPEVLMLLRRRDRKLPIVVWLLLTIAAAIPAAAQESDAGDPFRQLNDSAIAIYRDTKDRYLAGADPIVIAGLDGVVLRDQGSVRRVGRIPPAYHLLKAVGHAPRSLWAALRPAVEGLDKDERWRSVLAGLRPQIAAVLDALPKSGLSSATVDRETQMLQRCLELIDRYLAQGLPNQDQLRTDMRTFAPAILADAAEAARLQLDALDRDIRPWWDALSQAERDRTFVIVLGGKTMRPGNVTYNYFVHLLGAEEDGHRVVYAEGIFDQKGADGVLATLLTDRRLATDFFADERRMERDLLADGAAAYLAEIFGRTTKQ